MLTAQYFYLDEPVEVHGTNEDSAFLKIDALLVAVPIDELRIDHGKDRHQEINAKNNQAASEVESTQTD